MSTSVIEPGTRLAGRYRLDDRVSEAGGSAFWKATDEILARPVAALTFGPDFPRVGAAVAAARAASRLTDPRLTQVFDADDSGERAYVVSEWVTGETLEDLLAQEPLQPERAAAFLMEAAEALAAAHETGQAHLCLSPRSLVWTSGGTVKITGLGVEAVLCGASSDDPARTDAEGLGKLLYAALTGYWPGGGASLPAAPMTDGHVCTPRQILAGVPHGLESIVCRALGLPSRHGQPPLATPAEFMRALSAVPRASLPFIPMMGSTPPAILPRPTQQSGTTAMPAGHPPVAPPPVAHAPTGPMGDHHRSRGVRRRPRSNRAIIAIVAVVGLIAVAIGGWSLSQMSGSSGHKNATSTNPPGKKPAAPSVIELPPTSARGVSGAGSPDGRVGLSPGSVIGGRSGHWSSQHYNTADFGKLLSGVGLMIDMGHPVSVSKVQIVMPGGAAGSIQVRIGNSGTPDMPVLASRTDNASGSFSFPTTGAKAQYVLIWFSKLPAIGGQFKAELNKVTIFGPGS